MSMPVGLERAILGPKTDRNDVAANGSAVKW